MRSARSRHIQIPARYMVPLAPLLMILSAALIYGSVERIRASTGAVVATVVVLAAAIPTFWLSLRINGGTSNDPRNLLPEIMADSSGQVVADRYAGNDPRLPFLTLRYPPPSVVNTAIVVTSSFNYDRYQLWGVPSGQQESVQAAAQFFSRVLALPRIDISNGRPMFAYFNPTTTIIAMDGNPQRLMPVAAMIATTAPFLEVRWKGVPPKPSVLP